MIIILNNLITSSIRRENATLSRITPVIFSPGQEDMLSTIPQDVVEAHIIPLLFTAKNVIAFGRTSKKYLKLTNENRYFWINLARRMGIQTLNHSIPAKEQVKIYSTIDRRNNSLHAFVARIIGPIAFSRLPVLYLSSTNDDYIYVRSDEMTAPLMKGVDPSNRPFIALRYVNREDRDPSKQKAVVVFHRYANAETLVNTSCYECFTFPPMSKVYMEYMSRLIKHEPCGILSSIDFFASENDPIRTLKDGQSIVELV